MLGLLAARENGLQEPSFLVRAESTRRAFNLELSKFQDVEKVHSSGVNFLDVDPVENRYLLSAGADGVIVLHDLHNVKAVPEYTSPIVCKVGKGNPDVHKFSVETTKWYPFDTGMFVSSGMDHILKVWDTNTLKTAEEFHLSGAIYRHDMSSVATTHTLVAAATSSAKVRLIDLKSGSATHTLRGHKKPVLSVQWSTKDEFILATGGEDSKIMIWDIRSAKGSMMVLDQHNGDTSANPNSVNTAHDGIVNGLVFTMDGLHILSFGTDDQLRLWNTFNGKNTLINFGRVSNESRKSIQLSMSHNCSPDMAFVPCDSTIDTFEIVNGRRVSTLRGHYNQVNCCVFNQTNQELYSGANDRNILIWLPETDDVITYEDSLKEHKETKVTSFVSRIGAADNWSSDED